ncbi:MAG: helix-turn-helix transcriptional regulator [Veillonellaceae bacterium]|nr:helix-turn-helix transcriptional regulator [Veillonellaceae bacterium]
MTIGERLKALRKERGYSQEDVAKMLGIGRTTYLKYESGENKPSRKLKELASLFGVTTDYLLGRDDAPAPAAEPMGLTARDERDIERFDPVKAIFDDSDVRSLARDRLKGVSKEEIALKKQQLKAMVAAMWMKEENEK